VIDLDNKLHWTQKVSWRSTEDTSIWACITTGKFHFSDECGQLDETPYNTFIEALNAVKEYAKSL
jgi:hypothetical protein